MPEWNYREKRYLTDEEIAEREKRVHDYSDWHKECLKHKDELPPFNLGGVFKGIFTALVIFGVAALVFSIKPDKSKPDPAVAALKAEVERARLDAKFQTNEMKEKLEKAEAELKATKEKAENLADEKGFLEAKLNELKPREPEKPQNKNQTTIKTGDALGFTGLCCIVVAFMFFLTASNVKIENKKTFTFFMSLFVVCLFAGLLNLLAGGVMWSSSKAGSVSGQIKSIQTSPISTVEISNQSNSPSCDLHENCKVVVRSAKVTDIKQEGLKTMIYVEMEDGKKGSWEISAKFLVLRKHLIGEKIPIYEHHIKEKNPSAGSGQAPSAGSGQEKEQPKEKKTKEPRLEWL